MQHLNLEDLARLVDEPSTADEAAHLAACVACRGQLAALAEQTAKLAKMPEAELPAELWTTLRTRLQREGLLRGKAPLRRAPAARHASRWRAAAAVALFVLGGAVGAAATAAFGGKGHTAAIRSPERAIKAPAASSAAAADPALALRQAETAYLAALAGYAEAAGVRAGADPVTRLTTLEDIVSTTREALDQAPADPLINGYHLAALGQRQAALRQIARGSDGPWY